MSWRSKRTKELIVLAVSLAVASVKTARADTINVPGDYPTIQAGIDAAVNGDEVVVADGVYTGPGNRGIDFNGKLITVRSANGPDNCIIDCQGSEADPHRGFYFDSGETADAVVDGFTITNGVVTPAAPGGPNGGGLFLLNSSPTVTNCVVSGNTALKEFGGRGGGMYIDLGSPLISDCTFAANTAEYRGGGIFLRDGNMTVTRCTFIANSTPLVSQHGGGAIMSADSQVNLVDCDLHDNEGYHGGAVAFVQFFGEGASLTLVDCSITNNSAVVGGGVFDQNATALLINSTLIANQVSGLIGLGGGMVVLSDSFARVINTTIAANSAIEGGAVATINSITRVSNSLLWANIPDEISGSANVFYSNIQGGWFGDGNIDADPLFVDPDNDDYHISASSPCIDAAANIIVPKGFMTDLDGNPRFIEDPNTPDTGLGDCPIVDMGSYEFQEGTTDCCPWDLDGSGSVGAADLLSLLVSWGPCKGCPADFDGNGSVGASDLLALLVNWGPCP
ncbi:MAG: hypothetical protein V3T84_15970 [Phycisphaerales bacterium]